MGRSKYTDQDNERIVEIYLSGLGVEATAKEFGCSKSHVHNIVKARGLIDRSRLAKAKLPSDKILKKIYEEGSGVNKIASTYGACERTVTRRLTRLGILDSSRQHKSLGKNRVRRPKHLEFTEDTKKLRFSQESGVCQWCKKPIESYREATFHHIEMISNGGGPEPENCMVLHTKCHVENYYELHNVKEQVLNNTYNNKLKEE